MPGGGQAAGEADLLTVGPRHNGRLAWIEAQPVKDGDHGGPTCSSRRARTAQIAADAFELRDGAGDTLTLTGYVSDFEGNPTTDTRRPETPKVP